MKTLEEIKQLSYDVIGAAIEVQRELGCGLLESIYHECLKTELDLRDIKYESELTVPIHYKGKTLDSKLRCDLLVEECLVLELKASNEYHPIWEAQLLTYMKLLKSPKGLIINFNTAPISPDGVTSMVNKLHYSLPTK